MMIIGCDLHTRYQQIAMVDTDTGETLECRLEHANGEARAFYAARDRFGIKPLFYGWYNENLYFASEAKALFAAGVPARWDAQSMYHSVGFGGHQTRTPSD